jgi:hypothetical protein
MFLAPTSAVLFMPRFRARQERGLFVLICSAMTLLIGLRDEVGGDWFRYLDHFNDVSSLSFVGAALYGDPAYYLINWIVSNLGGDIHLVNLICAAILMVGVSSFCLNQPKPWIALLAAVPYLLVVVGMGYSRQSAAIGLALLGFVALGEGRMRAFVGYVILAAAFHKSAVLLIPIAALTVTENNLWRFAWGGMALIAAYLTLFSESGGELWKNYVEADMESQGAGVRVAMNVAPSILFILFKKRLTDKRYEQILWTWIAFISLGCLLLVEFAPAAVDRMALYLIPIQLFVFSRLHRVASDLSVRPLIVFAIACYYAAVLWVWLNFASHVEFWLPYKFVSLNIL